MEHLTENQVRYKKYKKTYAVYRRNYYLRNKEKSHQQSLKWYHDNIEKARPFTVNNTKRYRFGGLRESIIQRDKEKCINCGLTRKQHKEKYNRDITVNHIDQKGRYSQNPNHLVENLETLCISCHVSKDNLLRNKNKELL